MKNKKILLLFLILFGISVGYAYLETNLSFSGEITIDAATYDCAAGSYLASGETSCSVCLAGSYCPGGTYSYSDTEDQGINSCSAGTFSSSGATSCTTCATGSYSEVGASSCTAKKLTIKFHRNAYTSDESDSMIARQVVTYDLSKESGATVAHFGMNQDGTYIWGNSGDFGAWSKSGWTLIGLSESANSTKKTWDAYNLVLNSWINSKVKELTGEVDVYLNWKKTVTITLQPGRASWLSTSTKTCTMYNTETSCSISSPTASNVSGNNYAGTSYSSLLTFKGWNTTNSAKESNWPSSFSSDATYYAIFVVNKSTFTVNTGTSSDWLHYRSGPSESYTRLGSWRPGATIYLSASSTYQYGWDGTYLWVYVYGDSSKAGTDSTNPSSGGYSAAYYLTW